MTQVKRLSTYLQKHRKIDAMTALNKLGIARCAARIRELRDSGMRIETVMKRVRGAHGEARVAEYRV